MCGSGSPCFAVHSSVFMALPDVSRSIQLAFGTSRRRPGFPVGFRQAPGCCKSLLIHSPSDAAVGGVVNNPHSPAWLPAGLCCSWEFVLRFPPPARPPARSSAPRLVRAVKSALALPLLSCIPKRQTPKKLSVMKEHLETEGDEPTPPARLRRERINKHQRKAEKRKRWVNVNVVNLPECQGD